MQAALYGHSTEAEVREILAIAVKPEQRLGYDIEINVRPAKAAIGHLMLAAA